MPRVRYPATNVGQGIVGWRVSSSLHTDLALDAFKQALHGRRAPRTEPAPVETRGLTHQSDRGVQYLSLRYTEHLAQMGIVPSPVVMAWFECSTALDRCRLCSCFLTATRSVRTDFPPASPPLRPRCVSSIQPPSQGFCATSTWCPASRCSPTRSVGSTTCFIAHAWLVCSSKRMSTPCPSFG